MSYSETAGAKQEAEYRLEASVGEANLRLEKILDRLTKSVDILHGSDPKNAEKSPSPEGNSVRVLVNRNHRLLTSIEFEFDRLERYL
jgi:hypothetical protein